MPNTELLAEYKIDPKSIGIATATLYPDWHPSKVADSSSQVRGNFAVEFVRETVDAGYQLVVIDGGSSDEFKLQLEKLGVRVQPEEQKGMSPGRRQAITELGKLSNVEVGCWSEPEKVSFIRDCIQKSAIPIFTGAADFVIPKRDEEGLRTYPPSQIHYEQKTNRLWNNILRAHNLLASDSDDFDFCLGNRLFKNSPSIREVFMNAFIFSPRDLALDRIINPELWPNFSLLPIVSALNQGLKVASITVPYRHPEEQTNVDADSKKPNIQYKNAVVTLIQYIRLLEKKSDKPSRLSLPKSV